MKIGWKREHLSSLASLKGGFAFKSKEYSNVGIPILRMGNITKDAKINWNKKKQPYMPDERVGEFSNYLLEGGELVICLTDMSSTGHYLGTVAINDRRALLNQRVSKFVFNEGVINKKFLYYALCVPECRKYLMSDDTGSLQKNTSHGHVLDYEIVYPASLDQQKRIVAEIEKQFSRLDEAVANLKRVKANLKRYKAAVLKAAVEGKLTEEWRKQHPDVEPADKLLERILAERREKWEETEMVKMETKGKVPKNDKWKGKYKAACLPDTIDLTELPSSWSWVSWEAVLAQEDGAFKRGPFGSALKKSIFVESGYKVYEQYCPINDDPSFARYYITEKKYLEMEGFSVKARDFLVSCSGVTLGRITQIPTKFEEGVINQALLRVRINKQAITDKYFLELFRSPYFQTKIFDNSQGAAIPNVKGVKELKAIPIPLPPLAEQSALVLKIEEIKTVIDAAELQVDSNLRRADRLRQSILKKAFSGKLA